MIYESKELLDVHDDFKTQAHDRKVEMHGNGVSPGLTPATLRLAGGAGEPVSITSSGLAHAEIVGYLFCFSLEVSVTARLNLFASQGHLIAWLNPGVPGGRGAV
jgi:hypothetical protein